MRPTIWVDMDDVIADTLIEQIHRYNYEFNEQLTVDDLSGRCIWDFVPSERVPALQRQISSDDFYPSLSPVAHSEIVLERLQERYEVYIATAVMGYPRSFGAKYEWLRRHFPFVQPSNLVFCGNKGVLRGDLLIDDNPRELRLFQGNAILYSSPTNRLIKEFRRVNDWWEIERLFLGQHESS